MRAGIRCLRRRRGPHLYPTRVHRAVGYTGCRADAEQPYNLSRDWAPRRQHTGVMSMVDVAQALHHSMAGGEHVGFGDRFVGMTAPAEGEVPARLGFHPLA